MLSLYGASRDNDRCCARLGDYEISQLVPCKGTSQIGNFDRIVERLNLTTPSPVLQDIRPESPPPGQVQTED